ncbi:sulfatase-like hydrolase/transferase [Hydrogenophaga soli]
MFPLSAVPAEYRLAEKKPRSDAGLFLHMSYPYISQIWILFLLSPNLIWAYFANNFFDSLIRGVPPSFALVVVVLAWFRRLKWFFLIFLPFYALLPFEVFYVIRYHEPSNSNVLAVIFESSYSEASQYVGLLWIVVLVLAMLAIVALTIKISRRNDVFQRSRALQWIGYAGLLPLIQYGWLEWDWNAKKDNFFDIQTDGVKENISPVTDVSTPAGAMLSDSYPVGVFFRFRDYLGERTRTKAAATAIQTYKFHVVSNNDIAREEVYVLIIGESSRPDHWGLNGYSRDTTPRLNSMSNLVSFRNVVSSWQATRRAVPVILVGFQANNHVAAAGRPSIVSLFKQAGFKTYWISNQAKLGIHDSIISVHSHEADEVYFTNLADHTQQGNFDYEVVNIFRKKAMERPGKKFFVIHTMGSHKEYRNRYPDEFSRYGGLMPYNSDVAQVDAYDNSVFYTDNVVSEIIKVVNGVGNSYSAVFYISDHGENLPENGCSEDGHGRQNEADFRVASFIWFSDDLLRNRPELLIAAKRGVEFPYESVGVLHTLSDVANLAFPELDVSRSWISDSWMSRVRWVNAVPDFDLAKRVGECKRLRIK